VPASRIETEDSVVHRPPRVASARQKLPMLQVSMISPPLIYLEHLSIHHFFIHSPATSKCLVFYHHLVKCFVFKPHNVSQALRSACSCKRRSESLSNELRQRRRRAQPAPGLPFNRPTLTCAFLYPCVLFVLATSGSCDTKNASTWLTAYAMQAFLEIAHPRS
jgi:hypothetical protein